MVANTISHTKQKLKKIQGGFSLLEVIVVLAIIAGLAAVVLPSLNMTLDSAMSLSLRNFTTQHRQAYDTALFSGRMHRMVLNLETGEYWVEMPPSVHAGARPPLYPTDPTRSAQLQSRLTEIHENLDRDFQNQSNRSSPLSTPQNPLVYTIRSIPVTMRQILLPQKWLKISDSFLQPQQLVGDVVFSQFASELTKDPIKYQTVIRNSNKAEQAFGYIYYLPNGSVSATSVQLGVDTFGNGFIDEDGPQYTISTNTLTGRLQLDAGFQNPPFLTK